MSQLVTGEAVALDLRTAGLPSRVLAGALDATIQAALLTGLLALVISVGRSSSAARGAALILAVFVAVGVGYPVTCESLSRGRSPGKAAMGLRVVRDDGGPIGFRQAFVRGLVGFVIERPGVTLFSGAVITSLLNARGKRLGDLLAGTVVVQERVGARVMPVAPMPPGLAGWAATLDLGGLTDDLALSVRQFVARAGQLTPAAREQLGGQLVQAVLARTAPPPPPGTPGWAYLAAVLAERRRREEARRGAATVRPATFVDPPPAGYASAPPVTAPQPSPVHGAPSRLTPAPDPGHPGLEPPAGGFAPPA